ncbi:terminase small subunit [Paenibacillus chitinolyticus]|uniref:terminase small subunit n=1 Tax=Paenibacillus chitinolyticus TaxID=79263 RepID=UPI0036DB2D5F
MALTDKHLAFVNEYMKDNNATAAYLRAGYNCSEEAARRAASRLLTNVDVQDEIRRRQDKLTEESDISVKWVLDNLKKVAERCMQAEPLYDKETGSIVEYRFDSSGANKALETIGKHLGMFNQKVELTGGMNNTTQDITQLSPDERRARIDELNRRRGNGAHSAVGT